MYVCFPPRESIVKHLLAYHWVTLTLDTSQVSETSDVTGTEGGAVEGGICYIGSCPNQKM